MNYLLHPPLVLAILLSPFLLATACGDDSHALFNRLDANRNGQIAKGEIQKDNLSLFNRLIRRADANNDGQLTAEEFQVGLTSNRPEKPITQKGSSELPGADSLLLLLAWMDQNADLVITPDEVSSELTPLYDQFVEVSNLKTPNRLPVAQLRQQSIRYLGLANRFVSRNNIDVAVELALLDDKEWAYVRRLRTSLRPGNMMENADTQAVLFSELDTNGDGNVTRNEVPEPYAERFDQLLARADRNQDKQLSEQEFTAMGKRLAKLASNQPAQAETNRAVDDLLRRSDSDNDHLISREEAPPRMLRRFKQLDSNGDKRLDHNELSRAVEILAALRNSADNSMSKPRGLGERTKKPEKN